MKNVHLRVFSWILVYSGPPASVILFNFPTLPTSSGYSWSKNKHVPYKVYLSRHMIKFCQVLKFKLQKQSSSVFYKKGALRNFAKFTGKHLCWNIFLNKIPDLRPVTLLIKIPTQVFFYKFYEIFKKTFFTKHLGATASKNLLWPPAQYYLPHSYFLRVSF